MNLLFSKRKQYTCVTCNALNCAYFFVVLVHNLHERGPDRRGAARFYLFIFILSELFFHITHEGIHDHRLSACINSANALLLATEVARHAVFLFVFFLHLIPAHIFLILILQVASYKTHIKCQLTLITGRCGVLRSTRVLYTMLNRPGTRSNRLGPDLGSRVLCEDLYFRVKSSQVKSSFIVIPLHVWTYSGTRCRVSQDHGAT